MSDTLKVAKEPDAYLCLDDSGKPYACKLTVEAGEKYIPLYTSRILASQQAAYDAEIARLKESWDKALDEAGKAVYAANAACAMKDEALKVANAMLVEQESALRQMGCDEPNAEPAIIQVRDALSASPQQVSEWERKQLEPLQAQVAALSKDATRWKKIVALASHFPAPLESASHLQGRGLYVMYEGSGVHSWLLNLQDETLINFIDNQTISVEDDTQATAEQFIAECEQRGAVKALEEAADICNSYGDRNIESCKGAYECADHLLHIAESRRATSKKAG